VTYWKPIVAVVVIAVGFFALSVYVYFDQIGNPHHNVIHEQSDFLSYSLAMGPAVVNSKNEMEQTPLHIAVIFRREEAMTKILSADADVNAQDRTGMTPLHIAAMYGRASFAKVLLEHGAQLDLPDNFGDTPLLTAAVFGKPNVFQLLLDHGARADVRNKDGLDARGLAQKYQQADMIAYLDSVAASSTPQS